MGCGWLGFPLALSLISNGLKVKGTTTTTEKLVLLKASGVEAFHVNIDEKKVSGDFDSFLLGSQFLIINIPPKRSEENLNYAEKLKNIIPFVEKSTIKHIVFVSSTNVYAHNPEIINEDTILMSESENAKDLLAAEQIFKNLKNCKCYILRLAGLVNENRQPVRFLVKKSNIPNPNHAVNLIHLDDCIALIVRIIEKCDLLNNTEIFIGVNQQHQSREKFYTQKATSLGLDMPNFSAIDAILDKKIDNPKTREKLGIYCSTPV